MNIKRKSQYKTCGSVLLLPFDVLYLGDRSVRKYYDSDNIDGLTESIKHIGIIQPLIVRKSENDSFEVICGERRLKAAKNAGLLRVPCIVMNIGKRDSFIISYVDNIQRKKLSCFDESAVISNFLFSLSDLSRKTGKSKSYLIEKSHLMYFDDNIKRKIIYAGLSELQIKMLFDVCKDDLNIILDNIIFNNLKSNEAENLIKSYLLKKTGYHPRFQKINNIKLFLNTVNHAIDTMRRSGINADSSEFENDEFYEFVIRIPKLTSSPVNSDISVTTV